MFDELVLGNLESCFQMGTDDAAFQSAIVLTFTLASTMTMHTPPNAHHHLNYECLELQTNAIYTIRKRIGCPSNGADEPTIGAILLLANVEVLFH